MPLYKFENSLIFQVNGRDAKRYLHARLTQDIGSLEPNRYTLTALVNAQGKTDALFSVLQTAQDEFLLCADGGDPEQIVTALLQFKVTEQLQVELRNELSLTHIFPQEEYNEREKLNPESFSCQDGLYLYHRSRTTVSGIDIIGKRSSAESAIPALLNRGVSHLTSEQFLVERSKASAPIFPEEIAPGRLFAECDMDPYVSFTKGCYVGQEVLEKIDSRGKPPRRLRALTLEGSVQLNGNDTVGLYQEGDENIFLGKVLNSAFSEDENRTFCFALLKNIEDLPGKTVLVNGTVGKIL